MYQFFVVMSNDATETNKGSKTTPAVIQFKPPFPVCCVGRIVCKQPDGFWQQFSSDCDNCSKECHDCCGEHLDVPDKLLETEPGFYCNKCIARLPRYLYPKMPKDGMPRNLPDKPYYGYSFAKFIDNQKKIHAKRTKLNSKRAANDKKRTTATRKKPVPKKTTVGKGRRAH
jgi:hypothetical protein